MKKRGKTVKSSKCPKCGHNASDLGVIRVGRVFAGHGFGYRSDKHHPYADHVSQQKAEVCLKCGYTEIFFDVEDLKRKLKS